MIGTTVRNGKEIVKSAIILLLPCLALVPLFAAPGTEEKIRNDKVSVTEVVLEPGEVDSFAGRNPSVTVYWRPATFEVSRDGKNPEKMMVSEGEAVFQRAGPQSIKNTGGTSLRYVRSEFLTQGNSGTWGKAGLAPDYKLLLENQYARVYDIRIPAHSREPQHTHHDRVVVCLSGATLKHLYPDGHEEPSTLATGQIAWRRGGTHIGQNLGDTPLWVIAVEPK